jgi:hypothetical protein
MIGIAQLPGRALAARHGAPALARIRDETARRVKELADRWHRRRAAGAVDAYVGVVAPAALEGPAAAVGPEPAGFMEPGARRLVASLAGVGERIAGLTTGARWASLRHAQHPAVPVAGGHHAGMRGAVASLSGGTLAARVRLAAGIHEVAAHGAHCRACVGLARPGRRLTQLAPRAFAAKEWRAVAPGESTALDVERLARRRATAVGDRDRQEGSVGRERRDGPTSIVLVLLAAARTARPTEERGRVGVPRARRPAPGDREEPGDEHGATDDAADRGATHPLIVA